MEEIPNNNLKAHLLPQPSASWGEISGFAHSFNGYEHWGAFEKCSKTLRAVHRSCREYAGARRQGDIILMFQTMFF